MGRSSNKRQKTARGYAEPLGSRPALDDPEGKDDEELQLEASLFGSNPVKSKRKKGSSSLGFGLDDTVVDGENLGDFSGYQNNNELEGLADSDLFFVDAGPSHSPTDSDANEDDEPDAPIPEASSSTFKTTPKPTPPSEPPTSTILKQKPKQKRAAWTDPDDAPLSISLSSNPKLRKLRDTPSEDLVSGAEYEAKLRRQFERIHGSVEWAAKAREKVKAAKRKRESMGKSVEGDDVEDDDENDLAVEEDGEGSLDDLLRSTSGILRSDAGPGKRNLKILEKGSIAIERLRDANQGAKAEGEIKALGFHPSSAVPLLFTASSDRRLRLFNVDGHTNPHLQTLHIPSLPLTSARFHPSGTSILLTGPRPFYYVYDLQSGHTTRSPRGLWGTTFRGGARSLGNRGNSGLAGADGDMSMEICDFDSSGSLLAVGGRRGYVHIVDWKSAGAAGQVVGSVKMNSGVKAVWWVGGADSGVLGSGGTGERPKLVTLGEDAEVYLWDVGERRCLRRWKDDGAFGSRVMRGDGAGRYLGIGSSTGIVNVYGSDSFSTESESTPKPLKTLKNLTTSVSTMRFNHDSQLLALGSHTKKDQMRLIHLPSLTAFSNWPTSSTPLGHVSAMDFSANSEYLAIGNHRGRVLLYNLLNYTRS